ncbi:Tropinone reductase-like [Arachis hypogaea]|uniref:Tropinone reductase-like n=1 Tax=Arachis hypogaea TaxID=3818 RepID=A0A6B9VES3_ARAHY|nr:Tropinone reductase-like [Arachis hypogaea]
MCKRLASTIKLAAVAASIAAAITTTIRSPSPNLNVLSKLIKLETHTAAPNSRNRKGREERDSQEEGEGRVRTAPAGVTATAPSCRTEKREVRAEEGEGQEGRAVAAVPMPPPFGLSTSCCQNRARRKPSRGEASRRCHCPGRLRRRRFPSLPPSLMSPVTADLCSISPLSSGTGFAIAKRLGLEGASVVISSCKQQNVEEAAEKLRAKGIKILALVCHVSNDQQRKDLIQKTAQCGNIDVIVSNATANPSVDPILQTKDSILDKLHLPCKALAAEMAPNTRVNCIAPDVSFKVIETRFHFWRAAAVAETRGSWKLCQENSDFIRGATISYSRIYRLKFVKSSCNLLSRSVEMVTTCYLEGSRIF